MIFRDKYKLYIMQNMFLIVNKVSFSLTHIGAVCDDKLHSPTNTDHMLENQILLKGFFFL